MLDKISLVNRKRSAVRNGLTVVKIRGFIVGRNVLGTFVKI